MEEFFAVGAMVTYHNYSNGKNAGRTSVGDMSRNNGGARITSGRGKSHSNMAK
jgi:hypothetical protein